MAEKLTMNDIDYWYRGLNIARTQSGINLSSVSKGNYTSKETYQAAIDLLNNISKARNDNNFLGLADYNVPSKVQMDEKILLEDRTIIEGNVINLLRTCNNMDCKTVCQNTGVNSNQINSHGTCQNGINTNAKKSNGTNTNDNNSHGLRSNGTHQNGVCQNKQYCSQSTHSNGTNTDGTNGHGTHWICLTTDSDGTGGDDWCHDGVCWDGSCSHGTMSHGQDNNYYTHTNGTCNNVALTNLANSNETCQNGIQSNVDKTNGTCSHGNNSNTTKSNGCVDQIYDGTTVTYNAKTKYTVDEAKKRIN